MKQMKEQPKLLCKPLKKKNKFKPYKGRVLPDELSRTLCSQKNIKSLIFGRSVIFTCIFEAEYAGMVQFWTENRKKKNDQHTKDPLSHQPLGRLAQTLPKIHSYHPLTSDKV